MTVKNKLEAMDEKFIQALNSISSDKQIWEAVNLLFEKLISQQEFEALNSVKPYRSMDDLMKGSTKQIQIQGKALGIRLIQDLFKFAPDEVQRREKDA